jgi:arabinofuranosyltransferase
MMIGRAVFIVLLLVLAVVLVRTAWLGDDAYISLRTVENFVDGHGLRWNVAERVQSYTHPLWVLLLSGLHFTTRELYLTVILASIALSWLAVTLAATRLAPSHALAALGVLALILSPSFVNYSTSGLENPLSFLLLVMFLIVYWSPSENTKRLFLLALIASLALMTRMDHVFLYAPPLVLDWYRHRSQRATWMTLLGFLPFVAWTAFAVVYYGFPVPNSAVAKLSTGISRVDYVEQGLWYYRDAVMHDPLTSGVIASVLVASLFFGDGERRALGMGVLLYLVYVLLVGGDFMRGRFLSVPYLLSVLMVMRYAMFFRGRFRIPVVGLVVLLGFLVPDPTLLSGSSYGSEKSRDPTRNHGIFEERRYYFRQHGWLNGKPLKEKLGHDMDVVREDRSARTARILEVFTAGRNGFMAGPRVHVIDEYGLGDALLARLSARDDEDWMIGHFARNTPSGYLLSVLTDGNRIRDPKLNEFYAKIKTITRGDIWNRERWANIVRMNLGRYDHLVEDHRDYLPVGVVDHVTIAHEVPDVGSQRILWEACKYHLLRGEFDHLGVVFDRLLTLKPDTTRFVEQFHEYARRQDQAGETTRAEETRAFVEQLGLDTN